MSAKTTEPETQPIAKEDASVSRREVLGALGFAGASVLAGGVAAAASHAPSRLPGPATSLALSKPYVRGAEHFGTHEERWVATSCGQCPAGCGVRVRVVEGRAVRVEGNPANPLNRGGIGPRGLSSLQALYDADRIPGPLVRDGGRLVPIGWDAAIARLSTELAALRERGTPEKLLVLSGRERGCMHDLLARFCAAFGTPNFVDGRPSRSSTLAQAMLATTGTFEIPTFDWGRADYVLSLEAGLLEDSCQLVYLTRMAADIRRGRQGRRTGILHAGPAFDLAALNADDWIPVNPGSSCALALGIAHILVRDGLYDTKVATEKAVGFEAFAKWVLEGFPPERAAEVAGVSPRRVEHLADQLVSRRPSFVFIDERSLAFSNGWETALAALALNALLGALGTLVHVEPPPPCAEWPALEPDDVARAGLAHARIDGAGTADFPLARSVHETLPEAMTGDAAPAVVLLDHANPAYARQQPDRWKAALARAPFVVSFSPFRDECVASVAHLVLPDHTFLERWDDAAAAPGAGVPVVGVRRPVVEPVLDTRSETDVLLAVARTLGEGVARAFPWENAQGALRARLRGLFEARRGSIVEKDEGAFLTRLYEQGFWTDADAPVPELARIELRTEYAEPAWQGDAGAFRLQVLAYRPVGYAEGSGANLPWLRQLRARPNAPRDASFVTLHPDSAPGIRTGDLVDVVSPFGAIVATARIDPRAATGCVAIPMGGGHEAFGRWAEGRGANVMRLLAPGAAPHSGANLLCGTRARVTRRGVPA
jgi:anaerobic selenocysteine-containing dehydrogenase